jgi:hypothetical protein
MVTAVAVAVAEASVVIAAAAVAVMIFFCTDRTRNLTAALSLDFGERATTDREEIGLRKNHTRAYVTPVTQAGID